MSSRELVQKALSKGYSVDAILCMSKEDLKKIALSEIIEEKADKNINNKQLKLEPIKAIYYWDK